MRPAPTTADPTLRGDQRPRCKASWGNRSPATWCGAALLCSRTRRVRSTNPPHPMDTHQSARHTPGHINARSTHPDTSMPAAHTRAHQWPHTNRPERIRPRADAQASKRHTAGISRAVWPIKTMQTVTRRSPVVPRVQSRCCNQPRLQRLDSQSGSDRAAPGCKHDARLS